MIFPWSSIPGDKEVENAQSVPAGSSFKAHAAEMSFEFLVCKHRRTQKLEAGLLLVTPSLLKKVSL